MASNNEEIIQYHIFLKNICKSTNPQDSTESLLKTTTTTTSSNTTTAAPQLRNRITCPDDAEGEVIYWILKFLDENKCPTKLISPIVRNVLVEILNDARFKETNGLRALATTIVEDFCASLLNNVELNKIIDTATSADLKNDDLLSIPIRTTGASTNARRKMEDRTICIDEFHKVYDVMNSAKSSFYGVFDGHNGYAAAHYVASQLPYIISKTSNATTDPVILLQKSFQLTDSNFISRGATSSGTTAVCALYRPEEKRLFIAYAGDSKAMLAKQYGKVMQLVKSHRPDLEREKNRVLSMRGFISSVSGVLRVNGTSNVTRSLGDAKFKPVLTGDPDCIVVDLDGKEEFLVLATDGLWDHAHETEIARTVYDCIKEDCENLDLIPSRLIKQAQDGQSTDNISVVVIFFKHPSQIAKNCDNLKIMESEFDNIKEVEYYDYSRNFYPTDENTTSNNSHAVDSKQMRWTPNDNLNNIISDEVNQTTTTTTTTSATTNNGQFDDNLLNSSDNIDLNQKLSPLVGSGDDNSLHHASTLENNGEEFLATGGGGYDNKNGKLLTPTTTGADEFDDNDHDDEHNEDDNNQQQHQKILLDEKNHQPHHHDVDNDYGPETCVDVTDDVVMMTENSADTNNLSEQSTLSHSKDTLPSSDNCNPFDNKNALDMEETNEFHIEHAGGVDAHHIQLLDDANKATPLLSPEVEDLPLSSDGQMHFTNEGYQQSPLEEMIPAMGIVSSQKQFEDEFMQSNGHLSPIDGKDHELEKEEKLHDEESQEEIDALAKLDKFGGGDLEEVQDMSNQKPELVENFFGNPIEPAELVLQEKEILFNNMNSDENDFRLKDEEEVLEKHVVESEEFAVKETSEALDLSQKEQLQHSLHNLEVDILEEKPILTGHYLGEFDESPLDELAPAHNDDEEEKLNEFADEKQDKEEFPEKEDKIEEKLSFVEQKSTPSEEIELEEDNCIHLEEDVRPSDYLAMLERQKEEQQHQQLGQLDEGFEKDVQFEEEEDDVMIKSEKEHENSLFEDDNKVSDEMMEKEKSLPEEDNHISDNQLASNEYEKPLYEVEEFEKIAELQKQLQQPDEASMIAAEFLDNNKLESEVVSMIEEQISLIEDAIVQPEKQCFEEPEKVQENLDLENNEQSFEEVEKQLEEQHIDDKPLPEPNNLADFGDELENRQIEGMNEQEHHVFEEVEKQTEENTEKQFEDLNTSADLEELEDEIANGKVGLEEQVFDEMEKQLEEDTEKELLNTSSNIEEHENRDVLEPMDTQLDNATKLEEDEEVEKFLAEQSFEGEVEKQLEENNEKQSQDTNILPAADDLEETEELENKQQIVETEEEDKEVDSCLEDIDKQVHVLAEFVEDLENKHFEELKLDDAAKIFGECSEEQLQQLEQQVLDANTIPFERAEKIVAQPLFSEPDIDPENMMEVEEPIIVKEQVPIKPSALPVSGQEPSAVQPTHESCDESEDDEWKYTKEGQGEKQLGLQGDTVVEEELPQELQDAGVTFSINERKASGNILQQQISINTSNLIESINDTFEGLTQNITELADQAAAAAVTDNKEETLEQGIQNLNLSQSSTREKLDNIEDDEELSASEMNSRLNPEAKEFVPTFSPPSATENGFGSGNNPATAIPHHFKDELISQSPRKGRESNMEDIKIPAENEFEEEIAHKPHELTGDEAIIEPTENGGTELFQEMNWKEAMHGSEKEEGPLVDSPVTEESLEVVDNQMQYSAAAPPNVCELSAPVDLDNAGMKESIYIENNTSNDDLNSVQILPVDDIEIEQDAPEMKDNDVISKEEVQEILTLASDEKIETRIEEEIEQKMENLLLSHDKEFTKDINQMEAEQIPINGVEMPCEEPAAIQMEEQIIAVSEPIVEQKPQEPSAPPTAAEESAPSPVPVAEEALEGLGLGAAAAVVAATAVATVAATTAATTKSAVKKVEDEKNQKNLKKTSSATKSKVPDTKKPAVGSAAAKTSTVSSVSAAAKRTLADKPKPAAAASSLAAKKTASSTVSAAAPRPRAAAPTASAGVKSAIEKKTTTSTTSTVKSRIDAKAPTTLATRKPLSSSATKTTTSSKPGDETKSSSSTVKSSTIGKSTLGSKPSVGSTRTSATNSITKPRPATASSAATTNGIATKTATAAKPTTLAPKSAGAAKPSTTSPRGTLTSTLRKTEAVKSPTKTTSSTITSRVSTNGVTKSTTTTRTTTTKTTPSSTVPTRTTTSRLSVTGTTTGSTTPTSKTTTNNILASRKSTPLKKTTTNSSTTPTARKSIGSKLNSSATKPTTKDSSTPRPVTIPAQHQQQNSIQKNAADAAAEESKNAAAAAAIAAAVIEEPKLNGNASPDDVLLPSITEAAQVAAPISHPLIEMETV